MITEKHSTEYTFNFTQSNRLYVSFLLVSCVALRVEHIHTHTHYTYTDGNGHIEFCHSQANRFCSAMLAMKDESIDTPTQYHEIMRHELVFVHSANRKKNHWNQVVNE